MLSRLTCGAGVAGTGAEQIHLCGRLIRAADGVVAMPIVKSTFGGAKHDPHGRIYGSLDGAAGRLSSGRARRQRFVKAVSRAAGQDTSRLVLFSSTSSG